MKLKINLTDILLVIIAASLGPLSILSALTRPADEASGWWQLAVVCLGLPILSYQMKEMQEEQRRARWKPEISIGVVNRKTSIAEIQELTKLPTSVTLESALFSLVIRNQGKLAARWVKIHLTYETCGIQCGDKISWVFGIHLDNPFATLLSGHDFIFRGDANWVLYPGDTEVFAFKAHASGSSNEASAYYSLLCTCTIYAEGLEKPLIQQVEIVQKVERKLPKPIKSEE